MKIKEIAIRGNEVHVVNIRFAISKV